MNERVFYDRCPLCEGMNPTYYLTADCAGHPLYHPSMSPRIHWKQCQACKHIFTDGYFTESACRLIFGKSNPQQLLGNDIEQQRWISARIIEKILPFSSTGNWLDVGFGNGSLLFTAQEYGFIPMGTDLRRENASALSSLGIQAHCLELEKLALAEECAVISMADVLEHMPFPKRGLQAVHRLLGKDGILFASMPNTESFLWQTMNQKGDNPYWGEIEHYHNFSRSRLYELLRETGFEPLRYGISERYRACMEIIARKV